MSFSGGYDRMCQKGIEDGATPLEYDEIKGLIPTHITTKEELDALELDIQQRTFLLGKSHIFEGSAFTPDLKWSGVILD